jgi:hypothetical protein
MVVVLFVIVMSTRTRSRGTPYASSIGAVSSTLISGGLGFQSPKYPNFTYAAGTYYLGSGTSMSTAESRETITDVTGSYGGFHPCTHDSVKCEVQTFAPYELTYINPGHPFGTARVICVQNACTYLATPGIWDHVSHPDGTLVARARVPMIDRKTLNGLVSLYELKDVAITLGEIAATLLEAAVISEAGGVSKKKAIAKIATRKLRELRSSPLAALKGLINAHLTWKFGIDPLIKDIQTVHSALGRLASNIEKVQKPFRVTGSFLIEKSETFIDTGWNESPATLAFYKARVKCTKTTRTVFTEGALRQLKPGSLPRLDMLRLAALRDSLGLNPSLKQTWQAIPRSFILDWFFPISNYLEQLDGTEPANEWFTTINTWSTVKSTTDGRLIEEYQPLIGSNQVVQSYSGLDLQEYEFRHNSFSRSELHGPSWTPATPFVPEPRVPSLKQWFLSAEVALQRVLHPSQQSGGQAEARP